jgi:hypothetical protein
MEKRPGILSRTERFEAKAVRMDFIVPTKGFFGTCTLSNRDAGSEARRDALAALTLAAILRRGR